MQLKRFIKDQTFLDILIIIFIWAFLISYLKPSLLFLKTITAGGDTASHYYSAQYLRDVLLPQGKVMGWAPANYAGFPLFYHYFPFPFLLMALLGYVIPLQISFKLITVLGTFLLPIAVYLMFRIMKYDYPVPILGAIFPLAFLFNERNSMWGGNIPSTLAGEFSFSLSLAVFVVLIGTFYRGISENKSRTIPHSLEQNFRIESAGLVRDKYVILNSILFFLMGFSHGYTLLFFMVLSMFFLFSKDVLRNIWYMFRVYALGGMLLAFWFLPFLANIPYVVPFHVVWHFGSLWEIFPPVLIPFFVLSVLTLFLSYRDQRSFFFGFAIFAAIVLYFVGPKIGLVDIRFLTFLQFFLTIFGAALAAEFFRGVRFPQFISIIFFLVVLLWVSANTTYIKSWIVWNYEGFEKKATWPEVKQMFDYLRAAKDGGRVVYENSMAYNAYGTQRIFESLRLFAGRDTLEGLYMQSSITAPFVFYIQSEISKDVSAPFWSYPVSPFNLKNGAQHLNNFAATQFIVRSDKVKNAIKEMPEFKFEKRFGVLEVYRVVGTDPHYVVPTRYEPVMYTKKSWKRDFYEWFKKPEIQEVPVVYVEKPTEKEKMRFKLETDDLTKVDKVPLRVPKHVILERVGNETIEFETSLLNHPHIIRVSYHPNWKVEGANRIYLTAPTFMMVYPKQNKVKLTFTKSKFNYLGEAVTTVAILGIFLISFWRRREKNI